MRVLWETGRAWAIAKKDMRIYYIKPPTIMFGVFFPAFLFLSFAVGRNIPLQSLIPGLTAITVFFTSSSIGPVIIPWERRTGSFERLLSAPVSLISVLAGKALAGFFFGVFISFVIIILGTIYFGLHIVSGFMLFIGIALSAMTFSSLGILFSSIPTENVGNVMMTLNFFRLPLIFISGIFIPLKSLPPIGQSLAMLSPLTYTHDIFLYSFGNVNQYPLPVDIGILIFFLSFFLSAGVLLHKKNMKKA